MPTLKIIIKCSRLELMLQVNFRPKIKTAKPSSNTRELQKRQRFEDQQSAIVNDGERNANLEEVGRSQEFGSEPLVRILPSGTDLIPKI